MSERDNYTEDVSDQVGSCEIFDVRDGHQVEVSEEEAGQWHVEL